MIGFNKPYFTGNEFSYIQEAIRIEKLSGNGYFTKRCHEFFEKRYGFAKCLLTNSATAALEMAALLIDIRPGDEVIIPSYTFVSTANAFILRGARIIFADSNQHNPNIDTQLLMSLVTPKTKAIIVVHYAGIACDMDLIMEIARRHNLFVIEDAAQAIDAYYKGRPLGSIGHLAAFSFHETKNISCGEGGMLVVNDERFIKRSEIIWEKGTNRASFSRGEIKKYEWIDIGSSFLPSEITAAFLIAQLDQLENIQSKRRELWRYYYLRLSEAKPKYFALPFVNSFSRDNAHIFYLVSKSPDYCSRLLEWLNRRGVQAIFHYLPLHQSPFYRSLNYSISLPEAERYGNCLLRLPLYTGMTSVEIETVVNLTLDFCDSQ
jgi:dTDP-4-amino-4,6-dideoxygalactose transaminase